MRVVQGRRASGLRRLSGVPASLRGAALLPGAALAVHRLRYELAFGSHADQRLAAQGHAYLSSLTPWVVLLAGLAIGGSLGRLASRAAASSRAGDGRGSLVRVWVAAALALVAIYTGQELLECCFASGHPGGLAGIVGGGGWLALPSAALIGALLTLALRVEAAVARLLDREPLAPARRAAPPLAWARVEAALAPTAPLARAAAGRAPPRAALLG